MYGTQTNLPAVSMFPLFENDVKMYGTQTHEYTCSDKHGFENDVKMYGTQTTVRQMVRLHCLRMM